MFQAVWSEMWRLRVRNLKLLCYVSGGLVRNVAVAGWVSHRWTWCGRPGSEFSILNASPAMSAGELCAKIMNEELKGLKHEIFDLGGFYTNKAYLA